MLLFLAIASVLPFHFHFDATEFANVVYQTACVTGRISCSRAIYERFWHEKYHANQEDEARFNEFGSIFDQLESASGPGDPMPFLSNDMSYMPGLKIRNRMVAAALGSKSPAEFRRRAAAIAKPAQAERLAAILAHFQQRLHPWWVSTGQPMLKDRFKGIEQRLRAERAPALAAEIAAFLETQPNSRDYYLHVVPGPEYEGNVGSGTTVLNQFCLEVSHRVKFEDVGWIAVHEFTHSVYEQAPQARKDALMRQFLESRDALAHPLYVYLNEALATAVQLLLVDRNGRTLDDPYTDPYIPRLGGAVLPLLRAALERRKTLYDGFTEPYLAAARAALGEDADRLQFRYSCVALVGDEDVRNGFLHRLRLLYVVTGQEGWSRFARLDGILILRYEQINFGDDDAEMRALIRKHRGLVFIRSNAQHEDVFMLGRDNAALEQLGKMWAESKERAREGLIFAID